MVALIPYFKFTLMLAGPVTIFPSHQAAAAARPGIRHLADSELGQWSCALCACALVCLWVFVLAFLFEFMARPPE